MVYYLGQGNFSSYNMAFWGAVYLSQFLVFPPSFDGKMHPLSCTVDLSIQSTRIVGLIFEVPPASYRAARPYLRYDNPRLAEVGLGTRLTSRVQGCAKTRALAAKEAGQLTNESEGYFWIG
jgi:hypothetical protein